MKKLNQTQSLITAVLTALITVSPAIAQSQPLKDLCPRLRGLQAPQPLFAQAYDVDLKKLLVVAKNQKSAVDPKAKRSAESGNYYFVMNESEKNPGGSTENSISVFTDKSYSLKISVPPLQYRPLSAKWVNSKILLITLSTNLHRSAYWLFDVEKEQIISTEFEEDGAIEWSQCNPSRKLN